MSIFFPPSAGLLSTMKWNLSTDVSSLDDFNKHNTALAEFLISSAIASFS